MEAWGKENVLNIEQATNLDMREIEAMYQRRIDYNDAHGTHQWTYEQVTWEAFQETYELTDYYVGKLDGSIVCGMFVVNMDTLYWPNEKKGAAQCH